MFVGNAELGHVTHLVRLKITVLREVPSLPTHRTVGSLIQAGDDFHQRAFSATRRTENGNQLPPFANAQVDIAQQVHPGALGTYAEIQVEQFEHSVLSRPVILKRLLKELNKKKRTQPVAGCALNPTAPRAAARFYLE
jgi:hypothetical protein